LLFSGQIFSAPPSNMPSRTPMNMYKLESSQKDESRAHSDDSSKTYSNLKAFNSRPLKDHSQIKINFDHSGGCAPR